MNDLHGRAFANDADYDSLSGRITRQSTIVGITRDGWKVRHTCVYIDIGRAAPVDAPDPDAMIEAGEHLPPAPRVARVKARKEKTPAVNDLQRRITAYLTEHGPTKAAALAHAMNVNESTISKHIRPRDGIVYRHVGWEGSAARWGLMGVHDAR